MWNPAEIPVRITSSWEHLNWTTETIPDEIVPTLDFAYVFGGDRNQIA